MERQQKVWAFVENVSQILKRNHRRVCQSTLCLLLFPQCLSRLIWNLPSLDEENYLRCITRVLHWSLLQFGYEVSPQTTYLLEVCSALAVLFYRVLGTVGGTWLSEESHWDLWRMNLVADFVLPGRFLHLSCSQCLLLFIHKIHNSYNFCFPNHYV